MKTNIKGLSLMSLALVSAMAAAQDISVTVDGKDVNFSNAGPRRQDGRVLVPLRGVFQKLGAQVDWRAAKREIYATNGTNTVDLRIGDRTAMVDGKKVTLDVPAMIVDGTTMVPIRFVSESLGADVHWNETQQLVEIMSPNGAGRAQQIGNDRNDWRRNRDRNRDRDQNGNSNQVEVIQDNTIIPVTLDTDLSSNESRRGDRFSATIQGSGNDYYDLFPRGSKIEGTVIAARAKRGNEPGMLELDFKSVRFPNGRTYPIDGRLVNLGGKGIEHNNDGRLIATGGDAKVDRNIYAGYGAGAGLIVGLLTKKPIEGTVVGGLLGYLAGQSQKDRTDAANVRLAEGTRFGVRLTQDLTIRLTDIRQ